MDSTGTPKRVNRYVLKAVAELQLRHGESEINDIFEYVRRLNRNCRPLKNLRQMVAVSLINLQNFGLIQKSLKNNYSIPNFSQNFGIKNPESKVKTNSISNKNGQHKQCKNKENNLSPIFIESPFQAPSIPYNLTQVTSDISLSNEPESVRKLFTIDKSLTFYRVLNHLEKIRKYNSHNSHNRMIKRNKNYDNRRELNQVNSGSNQYGHYFRCRYFLPINSSESNESSKSSSLEENSTSDEIQSITTEKSYKSDQYSIEKSENNKKEQEDIKIKEQNNEKQND